jgi:glycosyltransferase involved in cell wall biosynthesis
MKITFVTNAPNLSGGQRIIARYADKLVERGHEVAVYCWRRPAKPRRRGWRGLIDGVADRLRAALGRRPAPFDPASTHFGRMKAPMHLLDIPHPPGDRDLPDADVVVASFWILAYAVAALSPRKGAKVHFLQHHEVHQARTRHLSAGSHYLPLHKIAISRWLVDILRDQYGVTDVDLVPNSVDTAQFHAPPRGRAVRPTVGFFYSPKPFKGLPDAVRAVAVARARFPDLRVVSFGAAPLSPDAGLPPDTEHHRRPPQDSIRDIYAQCDVWLCSSLSEGFGLPPLEAMACRCPVVSTRVGGPTDLVREGVNGHLVDVGDAEALGARLIDVLSLPDDAWRAMSDAAWTTAQGYSWDDAATLFEQALERAVARARSTAPRGAAAG